MNRRKFVTSSVLAASALSVNAKPNEIKATKNEFYEFREYELRFGSPQANLDNYFKNALIPALNKQGIKHVGVFREIGKSEPAKIYVLIPYSSAEEFTTVNSNIKSDEDFKKNAQEYNALPPEKAPYARHKTSMMTAFDALPQMVVPAQEPRIFEIRTYESYSEDAHRRKVKMFNSAEIGVFARVKLNSVFFGDVVAGDLMPCLTYMLSFKNMEERDANWKVFSADPEWKKLSADPEYANAINRITKIFLEPLAYSQV